jgi:hypothetical protein
MKRQDDNESERMIEKVMDKNSRILQFSVSSQPQTYNHGCENPSRNRPITEKYR